MSGDNEIGGSEISSEISDKFNEVFSNLSESDIAEAGGGEDTEVQKSSAADAGERQATRRNKAAVETEENLIDGTEAEEGVESGTEEAGATEGPEAEVEEEEGDETPEVDPLAGLDPNHVLAAQQLGWSPEKIAKLAKADPELANETIAALSETYNNLSRQMLVGTLPAAGIPNPPQPAQQPQAPTSNLDKFYAQLQGFTEANGEDLGNFAKHLKTEVIDPFKQLLAEAESSREQARKTEAQTTMKSLSGKFGDFYGPDDKPVTLVQQQARATLGMVADQLRAGSAAQGRELSITEALNRAHLIVSANHQRQAVRTEIKDSLTKRSKALTAKPTHRLNRVQANGPSEAKAAEAVNKFWADKGIDMDLE